MTSRVKLKNILLFICVIIGLLGMLIEGKKNLSTSEINATLRSGQLLKNEAYPLESKFSSAYYQGQNRDYKHAVQTYMQLLEGKTTTTKQLNDHQKANIQYNIGNNLLSAGLYQALNDDGSLQDEAKFSFLQAKMAYEHALRISPEMLIAKFNLSLLNSITPDNMKSATKEKSGVELSNLPVGLP